MKFNTSYIIAGALVLLGVIWFAINNSGEPETLPISTPASAKENARKSLPQVQTRRVKAIEHQNVLELYGQTRTNREVAVKAETAGLVAQVHIKEGARVKAGQTLCRQDLNARQAQVDQAKANLRSIETDLNAARVLADKGYQSRTRVTAFEAQLDGARAALKQAEIEADNINIRAPFSGIWDRQDAQVGDYLAPGMSCGLLIDLSPLKADVQITEKQLGLIATGRTAKLELATGETVEGKVAFIEAKANPTTRTFRAEIHIPNDSYKLKAGVTATVRVSSGTTLAQQVPGNILTLSDSGAIGIRYVDERDIVQFAAVKTVDEDENGLWVTGLPDNTRVIIEGQDFVSIGMEVEADETYGNPAASPTPQVSNKTTISQ